MSEAHWGTDNGTGEVSQAVEAALAAEDECEQAKAWYAETIDNAEKAWAEVAKERKAGLADKQTTTKRESKMNDSIEVVDGKLTHAAATILTIDLEDIENLQPEGITKTQWELVVSRLRDWVDEELQNQVADALIGLN